jgi:hypothetical protein
MQVSCLAAPTLRALTFSFIGSFGRGLRVGGSSVATNDAHCDRTQQQQCWLLTDRPRTRVSELRILALEFERSSFRRLNSRDLKHDSCYPISHLEDD